METQNITLALPKELLRKVKLLAVEKQTSVSRLLTETLKEIVAREEAYARAKQRHLALLEQGIDLGTQGTIRWWREDLHER